MLFTASQAQRNILFQSEGRVRRYWNKPQHRFPRFHYGMFIFKKHPYSPSFYNFDKVSFDMVYICQYFTPGIPISFLKFDKKRFRPFSRTLPFSASRCEQQLTSFRPFTNKRLTIFRYQVRPKNCDIVILQKKTSSLYSLRMSYRKINQWPSLAVLFHPIGSNDANVVEKKLSKGTWVKDAIW